MLDLQEGKLFWPLAGMMLHEPNTGIEATDIILSLCQKVKEKAEGEVEEHEQ